MAFFSIAIMRGCICNIYPPIKRRFHISMLIFRMKSDPHSSEHSNLKLFSIPKHLSIHGSDFISKTSELIPTLHFSEHVHVDR